MTDAVVCIPWRDSGDARRRHNWRHVLSWWSRAGFCVSASSGPPGPFNIAAARNDAAAAVDGDWSRVLIFADADTIPQLDVVQTAILEARLVPGVIYPHDHYLSLDQECSGSVLGGRAPETTMWCEGPVNRTSVSGVVVCTVASWRAIGGFDERFTCWGGEDVAFSLMARDVLGRALRLPGHVWHLWHPRSGYSTYTSVDNDRLLDEYRAAAVAGPHALRELRWPVTPDPVTLAPGTRVRHIPTGAIVTLHKRHADQTGWWLDGGDELKDYGWRTGNWKIES